MDWSQTAFKVFFLNVMAHTYQAKKILNFSFLAPAVLTHIGNPEI
jgi:hypothetical protein